MLTWNLERALPDEWARRLPAVAAFLRSRAPELLCLQEATGHQLSDVKAILPEMAWFEGAQDARDERNAIGYSPRRYVLLEGGTMRLPRPRRATPRVATWVRLRDAAVEGAPELTVVNVHLDHESPRSRRMAADLLRRRFPHAVLAGDFNAEPGSEPHEALLGTHRDPFPSEGAETMVGDGGPADARYDWILLPRGVEAAAPEVAREAPSDHHALSLDVRPRRVDEDVTG